MEYVFKGNQECNWKVWGGKNKKQTKPKASKEKAKNLNEKLNIVGWSSSTTTDVI